MHVMVRCCIWRETHVACCVSCGVWQRGGARYEPVERGRKHARSRRAQRLEPPPYVSVCLSNRCVRGEVRKRRAHWPVTTAGSLSVRLEQAAAEPRYCRIFEANQSERLSSLRSSDRHDHDARVFSTRYGSIARIFERDEARRDSYFSGCGARLRSGRWLPMAER